MLRLVEVFGSVLIFRGVTAADVPANQAQPQMDPRVSTLDALFADVLGGLAKLNLIEMCALFGHFSSSYRRRCNCSEN